MIQLRKQDARHGAFSIMAAPGAGSIKTNEYRDVPSTSISSRLASSNLAMRLPGIFVSPAKDGSTLGPTEGVYGRIREFVSAVVADPNVQPNHAWRYTLKTGRRG